MADTYCNGNYHNYLTTKDRDAVTCRLCQQRMRKMSGFIPREKVRQIAEQFGNLTDLTRQQQGKQAELIRWCVHALTIDVQMYRVRGHESWSKRQDVIRENKENRKKALLYLEWLATQLEHQSVRSPDDNQPKEPSDVLRDQT